MKEILDVTRGRQREVTKDVMIAKGLVNEFVVSEGSESKILERKT